jgi:hypothetical protein
LFDCYDSGHIIIKNINNNNIKQMNFSPSIFTSFLALLSISASATKIPFGEQGTDHFAQIYPSSDAGELIHDRELFPSQQCEQNCDFEKRMEHTAPIVAANCSSIFFLGGEKVAWANAAAACQQWGMELADITIGNFNSSIASQFEGAGGFQTSWIKSWNGDAYNTCLSQNTGNTNCGGAITVPTSCSNLYNVLCVNPSYTPSCEQTSWCEVV